MNTHKPILIAGLIAAISMGSIGVAEASTKSIHSVSSTRGHNVDSTTTTTTPTTPAVDPDAAVLAKLVTAGTITQAQSTAILAALEAAHAARPSIGGGAGAPGNGGPGQGGLGRGGFGGPRGFNLGEDLTVVTSTLGITSAQLQTDLAAGKSLATIAGSKTSALITALVAAETTEINARVTAGKLTQAQATTLISGLNAAVTAVVNATPGKGFGGHDGQGGQGLGIGAPLGGSTTTPTPSN